jgi:hypothetical protein
VGLEGQDILQNGPPEQTHDHAAEALALGQPLLWFAMEFGTSDRKRGSRLFARCHLRLERFEHLLQVRDVDGLSDAVWHRVSPAPILPDSAVFFNVREESICRSGAGFNSSNQPIHAAISSMWMESISHAVSV